MTTNFPTSLDSFVNPNDGAGDHLDDPPHDEQHANTNDAIEALEAKVGVNSSAVATSLDKQMEDHAHTGAADDGGAVATSNLSGHTKAAHDSLALSHDSLSDVSVDDHHAESHGNAAHTSTFITSADAAPPSADYLVGTANGSLSAEIVVGTSPGGELGGTWGSPTVDATHSGSSHSGVVSTHEAAADPHTGYLKEADIAAKGDLFAGTADNTVGIVTAGANDTILMADSSQTAGVKWVAPAAPASIGTANSEGTSDDFARASHVHAHPDLTASALGHTKYVRKAANETVNNSSTLQDDDHLLLTVAANEVWKINLILIITSANATGDFKCGWTYPTGTTIYWGNIGSPNSLKTWQPQALATSPAALGLETDAVTFGSAAVTFGAYLLAVVTVSSTAGTLQFQWAQNTADASNTTLLAGSLLEAVRVA